jgi:hypothetical protein
MSGWANWSSKNDKGRPFTERPNMARDLGASASRRKPKLCPAACFARRAVAPRRLATYGAAEELVFRWF